MDYPFICPQCGHKQEVEMRLSEYTNEGHFCEKCQTEMVRDPESFCTSVHVKCDGFCRKVLTPDD